MKSKIFLLIFLLGFGTLSSDYARAQRNEGALSHGSHKVQLGDIRIHYFVSGHGPLLFDTAVGWGLSTVVYQNAFRPLEKHFTVVYVEVRGNGQSSLPSDLTRLDLSDFAADIDNLRKYLGLEKINLMGHSGGGSITLEYAEKYPTHLEKGILIAPAVFGDRDEKQTQAFMDLWKDDPKYKGAVEYLQQHKEDPKTDKEATQQLESFISLYFSDPDKYLPVLKKQMGKSQVSAVTESGFWAATERTPHHQDQLYSAVRGKLLIINGTVDWICPYEVAERLHKGVPGSVLQTYANVGHFSWIEEPDRFFRDVTTFLLP